MKYLCVDIGGSSMKYGLISEDETILEKGTVSLKEAASPEDVVKAVREQYEAFGRPEGGIAVSYCGELNAETGQLISGGSYPFMAGYSLREALEAACGTRVSVENDGNCAAIAEFTSGSLKGCTSAFALVVGTGLAGAVIMNGALYRGTHNYSGFLSLLTADITKPFSIDNIGAKSTSANYLSREYERKTNRKEPIDGMEFFRCVEEQDETAVTVLKQYAQNLANVIFNVQLLLDVEKISVGGGISIQPAFQKELCEAYHRIYQTTPLQYINPPKAELTFCTYYNDANLIGALTHHRQMKEVNR